MWKKTKKQILGNLIQLKYTKKKINYVVVDIIAFIFKVHINSVICFLIATNNNYVDFVFQILLSIFMYYFGSFFNDIVYIYKNNIQYLTNYFIENYSKKNMDIWKKKIIIFINVYLIIILYSINITSNILILYSVQYMTYLLILDYINNKKWIPIYKKYLNWYNKPSSIIYHDNNKILNYFDDCVIDKKMENNTFEIIE